MSVGLAEPEIAPTPLALEEMARSSLCRNLGLLTSVRAPTWRQMERR